MIDTAACRTSASAHTHAGVLPGPTPIAGFPQLYAALTTDGPPVARMSPIPGSVMNIRVRSRLGGPGTDWTRNGDAPCLRRTSWMIEHVASPTPLDDRWQLRMSAFLAFRQKRAL